METAANSELSHSERTIQISSYSYLVTKEAMRELLCNESPTLYRPGVDINQFINTVIKPLHTNTISFCNLTAASMWW